MMKRRNTERTREKERSLVCEIWVSCMENGLEKQIRSRGRVATSSAIAAEIKPR